MNEQVAYATMSDREKYLFDLQGFLVVKNFLDADEIQAFNEAIEANQDKRGEHASGRAIARTSAAPLRGNPAATRGQWHLASPEWYRIPLAL